MNVIKTTEHLTRRSFRRKIIAMGVSIFSALALFATGFASWIISSDANGGADGNIDVGVVTDKSITIENVTISASNISFNPAVGDVASPNLVQNPSHTLENGYGGRVYTDGDEFESMTIVFEADITGYDNISELTIQLSVPDAVKETAAKTASRTYNGQTENGKYIIIPTAASADGGVKIMADGQKSTMSASEGADNYWTLAEITDDQGNGTGTYHLTYVIKFAWGDFFGSMNPSLFYDTTKADLAGYKVKAELDAFRQSMHIGENEDYENSGSDDFGNFEIVLTAKAASGEN